MNNTMGKREYVKEQLIWFGISSLYFKIMFRCIPGYTYWQTWGIFILLFMMVLLSNFAITWKDRRNYASVAIGSIMVWGTFVTVAYFDIFQNHMRWVYGIVLVIAMANSGPILFRKIKTRNPARRKRIIKKRINRSLEVMRKCLTIGMIAIMVPLTLNIVTSGVVAKSKLPVTKVYGDEYRLDANIELISGITPSIWDKLNMEKRLDICQAIANVEGRYLGITHEINVCAAEIGKNTKGYYDQLTHQVVVDLKHLREDDSRDVVITILHECYHAYQHDLIEVYQGLSERQRNLMVFHSIGVYAEEFADYAPGEEDFETYYKQQVEIDARWYSVNQVDEFFSRVEKYLKEKDLDA